MNKTPQGDALSDADILAAFHRYGTGRLDGFTAAVNELLAADRRLTAEQGGALTVVWEARNKTTSVLFANKTDAFAMSDTPTRGMQVVRRTVVGAALTTQPQAEPADNRELLMRLEQMVSFLCGAGMLEEKSFGDRPPREPFWWRTPLRTLEK